MILRGHLQPVISWRPDWRIDDSPLLFLDLETTGLFPERGQKICQVALLDQGGVRLHEIGTEADGSFPQDLERDLLIELFQALRQNIAVGHNIVFDLRFLAHRAIRLDIPMPPLGMIDTLRLASRTLPDLSDHKLATVAKALDIPLPDTLHQALPDAQLARSVFETLVDTHHWRTLADVDARKFSG